MARTGIVGNDGSITMPLGSGTGTRHVGSADSINAWTADLRRVSTIITAFTDVSQRRKMGVSDITGTASGVLNHSSGGASPNADVRAITGAQITLTVATGCSYQPVVVLPSVQISVNKQGETTVQFEYENSDGVVIAETWDVA